ncbi:MAG: hypothetical protein ACTHOJ_17190 [Sphingomonas oligoaromativorans]
MKAGEIVIWHPVMLSGVPRRVEIMRLGDTFATVRIPAGDPNPNGNPTYTARTGELRPLHRSPAAKGNAHAHL